MTDVEYVPRGGLYYDAVRLDLSLRLLRFTLRRVARDTLIGWATLLR